MIGSFHLAENIEQLKNKQVEIHAVHKWIAEGRHTEKDIEKLSHLFSNHEGGRIPMKRKRTLS